MGIGEEGKWRRREVMRKGGDVVLEAVCVEGIGMAA